MSRHTTGGVAEPHRLTPREAGAALAATTTPITDEQAEAAARILATVEGVAA